MTDVAKVSLRVRAFDRSRLVPLADWLAVGVAVFLPWSTTASEICMILCVLAILSTLRWVDLRTVLASPAGSLPVLLWLAGVLGMAWAQVGLAERLAGVSGYHKLLLIPLLLAQFRRSGRALPVLYGFLASCTLLLAASWALRIVWDLYGAAGFNMPGKMPGIPVKDYIAQSSEFMVCAFALLAVSLDAMRAGRFARAAALAALALLFLADILYIATGRSALVAIPILFVIFGARYFGWKGVLGAVVCAAVIAGIAWSSSSFLRLRVTFTLEEIRTFGTDSAVTSGGARLEFWKKSLRFVEQAPLIGNGTGSMPDLYRRAAAGESGTEGLATVNPHNQYLAVAIELGLFGLVILIAMWAAHLALFARAGLMAWFGLVMVLQNVVTSAFNSHLFDFFHGWFYVFGVGVLGGMVLHQAARAAHPSDDAR
jgi:O-antigen ligase